MKVIFLDFDGVINNWDNFDGVDYNNVSRLIKVINATGAVIVATSSNKYSFQVRGVKYEDSIFFRYVNELKKMGVEIFDVTPYVDGDREIEIMTYLKNHPEVEEFLILDDEYICNEFLEHEVFLDLYNGIMDEHVDVAINILNGKLGFYPLDFDFNETLCERNERINKYHSRKDR